MDIKSKNNNKMRIGITAAALILLTILTMCFYPGINRNAHKILAEQETSTEQGAEINTDFLKEIYKGCYVLYMETALKQEGWEDKAAADVYLKGVRKNDSEESTEKETEDEITAGINSGMREWSRHFENYRSMIDYCIVTEDGKTEKNTVEELENAILKADNEKALLALNNYYNDYFILSFDAAGDFEISPMHSGRVGGDSLIKAFQQIDRAELLQQEVYNYSDLSEEFLVNLESPKNFRVIFGIPKAIEDELVARDYYELYGEGSDYLARKNAYMEAGTGILYFTMLILIGILMAVMTSRKIWKTEISMDRPRNWYLMEAAIIGIIYVFGMIEAFLTTVWENNYVSFSEFKEVIRSDNILDGIMGVIMTIFILLSTYTVWYLSLRFIRPVLSLGLKEYIRQYSFIYQIFPWLKKKWHAFEEEVGHIDFSVKSTKTIIKIILINFVILAVCSSMWFFGIGALIIYSLVLFFIVKKYYNKIGRDYQTMLWAVNKMADGDLDTDIMMDVGIFEPFKSQLGRVRAGFKKAVDEEVKSQRMKTDLITNVSHDLKTPLTAITTYIELLKKEDITEEERRSYIETLEKKSLRLKVLIEDLFEVSKATSKNITLNLMEVDVVNLMKQVSVEHNDKYEAAGLDLRWNVPEEKIVLMLDNQKTYRIFENLFVNAQKYAMPQSRVYVDVKKEDETVEITMKNMSAAELNFKAEEITERFVRGDVSRNTEGSGLGLAIAKSFTEAQGGKLNIEVDGDLFKVVIQWKCVNI